MADYINWLLQELKLNLENESLDVSAILLDLADCCNKPIKKRIMIELSELWPKLKHSEAMKKYIYLYVIVYSRDPMSKELRIEIEWARTRLLMDWFVEFAVENAQFPVD